MWRCSAVPRRASEEREEIASTLYPRRAHVFFNVSTCEPYQVLLGSVRLELPWEEVNLGLPIHLGGYSGELAHGGSTDTYSRQPDDTATHFRIYDAD